MKLTDDMLYEHAAEARDLWLSTLPGREDVPPHDFSPEFEKKMRKLRAQQRTARRFRLPRGLRTAAACLVLVTCIGGTAYAYRTGAIDMLLQTISEFTDITYTSETPTEEAHFSQTTLGYIPDGMTEVTSERLQDASSRTTVYEKPGTLEKFYFDEYLVAEKNSPGIGINTENAVVKNFTIAGEPAVSYVKEDTNTVAIAWTHGDAAYTFLSYGLSEDEALKIASNIQYN